MGAAPSTRTLKASSSLSSAAVRADLRSQLAAAYGKPAATGFTTPGSGTGHALHGTHLADVVLVVTVAAKSRGTAVDVAA
jgi:hypothetical protein